MKAERSHAGTHARRQRIDARRRQAVYGVSRLWHRQILWKVLIRQLGACKLDGMERLLALAAGQRSADRDAPVDVFDELVPALIRKVVAFGREGPQPEKGAGAHHGSRLSGPHCRSRPGKHPVQVMQQMPLPAVRFVFANV